MKLQAKVELFRPSTGKGDKATYSNPKDFIYFPTDMSTSPGPQPSTKCIGKWYEGPCGLDAQEADARTILPYDLTEFIIENTKADEDVFQLPTDSVTIHPDESTNLCSQGK